MCSWLFYLVVCPCMLGVFALLDSTSITGLSPEGILSRAPRYMVLYIWRAMTEPPDCSVDCVFC